MHYSFTSPDQKQKKELKKKIEKLNEKIDSMIENYQTDRPKYKTLLKLHSHLFYDLAK